MLEERLSLYEDLLTKRAEIEKECDALLVRYLQEFGEENVAIFNEKVRSIELKKRIAFCVAKENLGQTIYEEEMLSSVNLEMAPLFHELEVRKWEYSEARGMEMKPAEFLKERKLKTIYRRIVHMIHPDLHPEYNGNEEIEGLFNQAVIAYKASDDSALSRVYDRLQLMLLEENEIEIEDLEAKIEETQRVLEEIFSNEPYIYIHLLNDERKIERKHQENQKELSAFEEYNEMLSEELKRFRIVRKGQA